MKSNMFSFKVLLLVLALLAVTVQSWSDDLSGEELKQLYNSPVTTVEWMVELQGSSLAPFSRQGVRVTLESDQSQWLIHKGKDSKTVVTSARHMASNWKTLVTTNFNGTHTVADFMEHSEVYLK